jgi:hypothetical protein
MVFAPIIGASGFSNLGWLLGYIKWYDPIRGESYWAFTDGRGAYAEGLFGLRVQPNIWFMKPRWALEQAEELTYGALPP